MTNNRTGHRGAIEMFWLHFSGLVRHACYEPSHLIHFITVITNSETHRPTPMKHCK